MLTRPQVCTFPRRGRSARGLSRTHVLLLALVVLAWSVNGCHSKSCKTPLQTQSDDLRSSSDGAIGPRRSIPIEETPPIYLDSAKAQSKPQGEGLTCSSDCMEGLCLGMPIEEALSKYPDAIKVGMLVQSAQTWRDCWLSPDSNISFGADAQGKIVIIDSQDVSCLIVENLPADSPWHVIEKTVATKGPFCWGLGMCYVNVGPNIWLLYGAEDYTLQEDSVAGGIQLRDAGWAHATPR